jgi:hypothetical protein
MWPSHRQTSAPAWGSGAGVGRLPHWSHPGGGVSSSGISTAVAWELPARAGPCGGRGGLRRRLCYRSCGLLLRRGDLRLRQRLSGRESLTRFHGRRCRQRHYDWRRWLRLRHRLRLSHGWLLSRLYRRLPWLHGRHHRPRPRGLGRASRGLTRRCRRTSACPRRPR